MQFSSDRSRGFLGVFEWVIFYHYFAELVLHKYHVSVNGQYVMFGFMIVQKVTIPNMHCFNAYIQLLKVTRFRCRDSLFIFGFSHVFICLKCT